MAHSRGREYLADVGAVALAGWENRALLITSLLKIGHGQTGRSPFKLLRRTGYEIFMPHPALLTAPRCCRFRCHSCQNPRSRWALSLRGVSANVGEYLLRFNGLQPQVASHAVAPQRGVGGSL